MAMVCSQGSPPAPPPTIGLQTPTKQGVKRTTFNLPIYPETSSVVLGPVDIQ